MRTGCSCARAASSTAATSSRYSSVLRDRRHEDVQHAVAHLDAQRGAHDAFQSARPDAVAAASRRCRARAGRPARSLAAAAQARIAERSAFVARGDS